MSMKGKVPSLEDLEVGADFLRSDRSYDVILISTHKSKEQLDEYQNDPYHMEIKKHIAEIRDASVAVDWEI